MLWKKVELLIFGIKLDEYLGIILKIVLFFPIASKTLPDSSNKKIESLMQNQFSNKVIKYKFNIQICYHIFMIIQKLIVIEYKCEKVRKFRISFNILANCIKKWGNSYNFIAKILLLSKISSKVGNNEKS